MRSDTMPPEPIPSEHAMGMIHEALLPGENVIHVATISRGIYWKAGVAAAASLLALQFSPILAAYCFVIALGLFVMARMTKKFLLLAATDHRVIIRCGVVNQDRLDLRHSKIESIELLRTLPGMIFGYGAVILSGTGRMRIMVPFVQDAGAFRDHLTQKLLERETPLPTTPYVRRWQDPNPYAL
jgi:hypothetical protein